MKIMNQTQSHRLAMIAVAVLIGGSMPQTTEAAVITSATLPTVGDERTISDFVADSVSYVVTDIATSTGASGRRYFDGATDPGDADTAVGDNFVTTGLLNTAGMTFTLGNAAILAADVFFVTDINTSTGSADTFTFQAVDSGGGLLGSAFNIAMSPGGSNTLLTFDAALANPTGNITSVRLNGSTFTLADFGLSALELAQITGVRLTSTGGAGDPGLVGLAQVQTIPTPAALPAGLVMLGAMLTRRRCGE
jgi:uncharacterized protein (TIGR03382 family)